MNLKDKLKSSQMTMGSWATLANGNVVEIMAKSGFDWLAIDMEHSTITLREAEDMIRVIDLCGVDPLVRLSANDPVLIKRVMDAGAHGVIVPMVKTAEDAKNSVEAVRYPPQGSRGVGLYRAQGYGETFEDYKQWLAKESVVIVIIEHIEAMKNLEAILSVEGIDGSMIGPYDLSGSMGCPGELEKKEVRDFVEQYLSICKKMNKPAGYHVVPCDTQKIKEKMTEGFKFLAFSLDSIFLKHSIKTQLDEIEK